MCVRVCVSVSRTNVDVISEVDLIPLSNKHTGRLMTTPVLLWLPRLFMLMRESDSEFIFIYKSVVKSPTKPQSDFNRFNRNSKEK